MIGKAFQLPIERADRSGALGTSGPGEAKQATHALDVAPGPVHGTLAVVFAREVGLQAFEVSPQEDGEVDALRGPLHRPIGRGSMGGAGCQASGSGCRPS
jgi:hypothetical protein